MKKDRRDRLVGRSILAGWDALGRIDRIIERTTKIFIPFVVGLFLGYAWAFWHFRVLP